MFDAAAAATASEVATEQVAQEQAEAAVSGESSHGSAGPESAENQDVVKALETYMPTESRQEVVFVDPTVPNYQDLLAGMDPNIEVVMLDGGTDGVHQMASTLEGRTGIDAIHIVSHGSAGELHLGNGTLNTETMSDQYAQDLATIQTALSEQADILVYSCDFAKGDVGQMAVDMLAGMTGADVEASTDLTGSISLGGDWEFEVKTGTIETSLAISYDAQMNWAEVLGKESVSDHFSDKSYGNNDGTRSWSTNWSEVDVGASGANGGHIKVNSGELRIDTVAAGESVSRGVDLSGAKSATLSFDYTNGMNKGGSVEVRISTDGGAHYNTLSDGTFSKASHTGSGTASFDISEHMSADTKIQFVVTGTSGGDRLFIDNIQIDYHAADANTASTEMALPGSTVTEQAAMGTVGGIVSGTDADVGNTKTERLTEAAGGSVMPSEPSVVAPMPTAPAVEVVAGPELEVAPMPTTPAVEVVAGSVGRTGADTNNTKVYNPGIAPSMVVSLLQERSAGPDPVTPFTPSSNILNDIGRSDADLADDRSKPPDEWSSQRASMVDSLSPSRNPSGLAPGGETDQTGGSRRDGNSSTVSNKQDATIVNIDSAKATLPESGQVSWPPREETEYVTDDATGLSMPMIAGLVGAAFQGKLRTKEKPTALSARIPAHYQRPLSDTKSGRSKEDDKGSASPESGAEPKTSEKPAPS